MKKTLFLVSLLTVGVASAQNCSEIFISEYVEGSGYNKALELYNPTASPIDLSVYTVERHSNGDSDATDGGTLVLSGIIPANSTWVIARGSQDNPVCSPDLQAMADLLDGVYPSPTHMNGNDAIVLKKNGVMIDLFGRSGDAAMVSGTAWSDEFPYDGSVGAWWTANHTLIRKDVVAKGVTVNPDPFIVSAEWDSLPENTWTNLGTHTSLCLNGIYASIKENKNTIDFSVFPNPSTNFINITSSSTFNSISVLNILGSIVLTKENEIKSNEMKINLSSLDKGIYMIQIRDKNNNISTKQFIKE
jgi:hypothetical protein